MRIGIDARSVTGKVCGVSRVTTRLIESLVSLDEENDYTVFTDSSCFDHLKGGNLTVVSTGCSRMNPFYDWKFYGIVSDSKLDIFHSMHSWLPFFFCGIKAKKVLTIHDLFVITDPEFFSKYGVFKRVARWYFSVLLRKSVRNADMVLTVSNYSRRCVEQHFPGTSGRVEVVYNASGLDSSPLLSKYVSTTQKERYLLYVGNCRSYKNVPVLIDAFALYLNDHPKSELILKIAGNDLCLGIKQRIKQLGMCDKVQFLHNPTDDNIRDMYAGALAVILPSKEEGFGLPVLEAMCMGVPVIISDADALLEVAGGAALEFPKNSPAKLAEQINCIAEDPVLRGNLRKKGFERSVCFSWDLSAAQLLSCYKKCFTEHS